MLCSWENPVVAKGSSFLSYLVFKQEFFIEGSISPILRIFKLTTLHILFPNAWVLVLCFCKIKLLDRSTKMTLMYRKFPNKRLYFHSIQKHRTCILLSACWPLHSWDQAISSPHMQTLTPALEDPPKCDTQTDVAEVSFTSFLFHQQFSCESTWTNSQLCPATILGSAMVLDSPKRKAGSQISKKYLSTGGCHSMLFLPSSWSSQLCLSWC